MDFHMITHAVMFAVIATLVKKYFQLFYHMEELQNECLYDKWKYLNDEMDYDFKIGEPSLDQSESRKVPQSFISCQSSQNRHHVCHFKNLCYEPNEELFIYFYGEKDKFQPVDKTSLPQLSTPADFNGHQMSLTYLHENVASKFRVKWIENTSYIFNRFKSDNIMHVFHDDLLPVFHTLKHFENLKSGFSGKFDAQIVYMDDNSLEDNRLLYELFTTSLPLHKEDFKKGGELVCFSSAIVGLLVDTLWYNYGFIEPQGPIINPSLNSQHVKSASQFILENLKLEKPVETSSKYIVLISRKENRKILNENDLVKRISLELSLKVVIVASETHSLKEMISIISNSTGIVGMHGSLLILSIFLKPRSFLIELFPYAVPASQYTPYKTLAKLKGMGITYKSWENFNRKATIGHTDYPVEYGGILHLTAQEQSEIIKQKVVPEHLCCEDPSWLFHIYQDTYANIEEIIDLIKDGLQASKHNENLETIEVPSVVKNLYCNMQKKGKCVLQINWEQPWNIQFLNFSKMHYEILVEKNNSGRSVKYIVEDTNVTLDMDCDNYTTWVRSVLDDKSYGDFSSKECLQ